MAVNTQTGVIYREDNLAALSRFALESVDLVYLDPPFFSSRMYEVIWGDEAEVRSFEDRWDGGIMHYVSWMRDRVRLLQGILKPSGTLYLHCDPHASHYLKLMLDEVFGMSNFRNEVIWKRTGSKGLASARMPNNHDTILVYSKGSDPTWNKEALIQPYDLENLDEKTLGKYAQIDEDGRRYQLTYSFMVGNPIQVKRSFDVGRNVVDNFQTAMRRGGHDTGYIVGFSFTRNAREEVARARVQDGLDIRLVTVGQLLDEATLLDRIPELATVTELPIPPARPNEALPTAEELIESDLGRRAV